MPSERLKVADMEEYQSDQELIDSVIPRKEDKEIESRQIHSEEHLLAKEISEYCGEPKKFAMYLGVITRIGKSSAYKIFGEMKHDTFKPRNPGRWFMYKSNGQKSRHN